MSQLTLKILSLSVVPFIASATTPNPEMCSSVEGVQQFVSSPASATTLASCKAVFEKHQNSPESLLSIIKGDSILNTKEIWSLYVISGKEDEGRVHLRGIAEKLIEDWDLDAAERIYTLIGDQAAVKQLKSYKD